MSQTVVQDVIKAIEEALQKYKDEVLKHIPEEYKIDAEVMINDFIKETVDDLKEYVEAFTSDLIETYGGQKGLLASLGEIFKI
jgi:cell division ATPase FtsA